MPQVMPREVSNFSGLQRRLKGVLDILNRLAALSTLACANAYGQLTFQNENAAVLHLARECEDFDVQMVLSIQLSSGRLPERLSCWR